MLCVLEKEKPCPPLSSLENGSAFQLADGKTTVFTCETGYTIVGASILHCTNGNWSSHVPKCISAEKFVERK